VPYVREWEEHVSHVFPVKVQERRYLQNYLSENGIQTLIHYPIPPHNRSAIKKGIIGHFPSRNKYIEKN
jgi:dTDP-4-amino-4,6-dideoxygalactose transaminase